MSELQQQVMNVLEKATPVSIQGLQRYLQDASEEEYREFYDSRG